ncbi:MAG TPA: response regulator [Candidatus Binatia bacterium]|nr:response regulator [Candidatus Binatia bacterium]
MTDDKKLPRILVVDDDPFMIELETALLEEAGYEVVALDSAEEALAKIQNLEPDCVITDLVMPGVAGMQLLKNIKDDPSLSELKVIVLSSKSFEFDKRQAMQFGADRFIIKPIDAESFAKSVRTVLESKLELTFWGVRGTLPVPGARALRYGGNTSCVTIEFPKGQFFIFDAGSGIKELSNAWLAQKRGKLEAKIFISHPHWDHINALPFFVPLYIPGNEFEILGASHPHRTMRELISAQMDDIYFPITIKEFGSHVYFRDLNEGTIDIDGITIKTKLLSHPGNCLGYRVEYEGRSVCYVTDNELFLSDSPHYDAHYVSRLTAFLDKADVLITDCTYTDEEYERKVGWGHSCVSQVAKLAHDAGVETLYLFHHDPDQNDDAIDAKLEMAARALESMGSKTKCVAPAETDVVKL